jgi:hypothetical protein
VKQKPERLLSVAHSHQQVPRLLCDPATIGIARARHELDPTALE